MKEDLPGDHPATPMTTTLQPPLRMYGFSCSPTTSSAFGKSCPYARISGFTSGCSGVLSRCSRCFPFPPDTLLARARPPSPENSAPATYDSAPVSFERACPDGRAGGGCGRGGGSSGGDGGSVGVGRDGVVVRSAERAVLVLVVRVARIPVRILALVVAVGDEEGDGGRGAGGEE